MSNSVFLSEISHHIWNEKYRFRDGNVVYDNKIEDTWERIATCLSAVEPEDKVYWQDQFFQALKNFKFLPGGRIQAGAGTKHRVTLFNCFVMGTIDDSMESIFENLKEGALTMQQGGGVGYDFSTLRPRNMPARTTGTIASGPVSFMRIWDSMCATLLSTGARRGAMMATLRCDHPDIEEFIDAKKDRNELRHFNLSVLITDKFISAINENKDWPLVFPLPDSNEPGDKHSESVVRQWSGQSSPVPCKVIKVVSARELWEKIMRATYEYAEPGVLFINRINDMNNLWYREHITATNPCGEIPLPPYGACDLGAINLTQFVKDPFHVNAKIDLQGIKDSTSIAVRMLDNVIDASSFPLRQQKEQAMGCRRIGLGITGLADTLIMLGLHYGSDPARKLAAEIMQTICYSAYHSSIKLAKEKGAFPWYVKEKFLTGKFIRSLPEEIRIGIGQHGIRNSHLNSIAPTGTISILANNVSSGIEPVFDFSYSRKVLTAEGDFKKYYIKDYAYYLWEQLNKKNVSLPEQFTNATRLSPTDHLKMQAVLQPYIDNAISKTINVPRDFPFNDFRDLYSIAFENNLKGCTTYRPNVVTGAILDSA